MAELTELERGVLDQVLNPPPDEPHVAMAKALMEADVVFDGEQFDYKREDE